MYISLHILYNEIMELSTKQRSYNLGVRRSRMAKTRAGILEAARALFAQEGVHRVSVKAIAEKASVSRKTVYNHFGSKTGLLSALLDSLDEQANIEKTARAMALPDPVEALRAYIRTNCQLWAADITVYRNVFRAAPFDRELEHAVYQQERDRKAAVAWLVRRISRTGRLDPQISKWEAVDMIWLLTHLESFDFLYRREGAKLDSVSSILVRMAERILAQD